MFGLRASVPRAASSLRAFSTTRARSLAKMQLIGRLADQPEVVNTSTGHDVVRYSLAISTGGRDEQGNRGVSWFNVASFLEEGPRRSLLTSLPKGSMLYVEADAKMDSYQTQDGSQRKQLNLLARNFEVLSSPRNREEGGSSGAESDADPAQEPLSGVGQS